MNFNGALSETIQTKTLPEQISDFIKDMIMNQELRPGERIPEDRIAETLGVSRTPIREAIRLLQQLGLVDIVPRRFARVVEIDSDTKRNLGELRIAIDTISVRRLAETATNEQCDILTGIAEECLKLSQTGNRVELFRKDSDFHITMARMSGNPYLENIVEGLTSRVQLMLANSYSGLKYSRTEHFTHFEIIESLRRHDVDLAVEQAVKHLERFYFNKDTENPV